MTGDTTPSRTKGPLSAVKVIEVSSSVMGPYAALVLAQLGAEVVKIETGEGDTTRSLGPARNPGMSGIFLTLNEGKQSVELDLHTQPGRVAMSRLLGGADVLLHNLRPDSAARLGLDYPSVSASNPRIVHCTATGFGSGGRYAGRPAYDDIIQAASGAAALQGHAAGVPQYVTTVMADKVSGLTAAYAILAALFARERTGRGDAIEVPMFETMAAFVLLEQLAGSAFEPPAGPPIYARTVSPYRRPHRTKDGYVAVAVYTDKQWRRLLETVGRNDLIMHAHFVSLKVRTDHIDEVYGFLDTLLSTRTTGEWLELFQDLDIPAMPVNTTAQVLRDGHLQDVGLFRVVEHRTEGVIRSMRSPLRFLSGELPRLGDAPSLGRDTRQVLGLPDVTHNVSPQERLQ